MRIPAFALCLSLVAAASAFPAMADATDYRFEVLQQTVKKDQTIAIDVRLVHAPTGKAIDNAVVFQSRLDMAPDGMREMTAKVAPQPSPTPGVYRFQTKLQMEGDWALHLAAKVPGEADTVRGTVQFKAAK